MKKKIKANLCVFLGSICLPMAGADSESFVIQIIVTITGAALFAFFFALAASLFAQDKGASIDVHQVRAAYALRERSAQRLENHRFYLPL